LARGSEKQHPNTYLQIRGLKEAYRPDVHVEREGKKILRPAALYMKTGRRTGGGAKENEGSHSAKEARGAMKK